MDSGSLGYAQGRLRTEDYGLRTRARGLESGGMRRRYGRSGKARSSILSPSRPQALSSILPLLLSFFLPLVLAFMLCGCGLKQFSSSEASVAAHTVFLTHADCSTFVAQTLREGMTLVENADASYTPSPGNVLEGPARLGPSVFTVFGGSESRMREGGRSVSLNIVAKNLDAADAREQLNSACE